METGSDLLCDQGGVAAGLIVDDQVHPEAFIQGRVYDLGRVLDHLRIQHIGAQFVEREGLGIGFVVAILRGLMSRMTTWFPELIKSALTLANCFRRGGSQVRWSGFYAVLHGSLSILPDRPGIPVTHHPKQDGSWETAKQEAFIPAFGGFRHEMIYHGKSCESIDSHFVAWTHRQILYYHCPTPDMFRNHCAMKSAGKSELKFLNIGCPPTPRYCTLILTWLEATSIKGRRTWKLCSPGFRGHRVL